MTPTPRPRKPWYRTRNLVLGLLLTAGYFGTHAVHWAIIAVPSDSFDTDAAYRQTTADLVIPGKADKNAVPLVRQAWWLLRDTREATVEAFVTARGLGRLPTDPNGPQSPWGWGRRMDMIEQLSPPQADLACALAVVHAAEEAGLPALIDEIAGCGRYVHQIRFDTHSRFYDLTAIWELTEFARARIVLAGQRGDDRALIESITHASSLVEFWSLTPLTFTRSRAIHQERQIARLASLVMSERQLDPVVIDAIGRAMPRGDIGLSDADVMRFDFSFRLDELNSFITEASDGNGTILLDLQQDYLRRNSGTWYITGEKSTVWEKLINLGGLFMPRRRAIVDEYLAAGERVAQLVESAGPNSPDAYAMNKALGEVAATRFGRLTGFQASMSDYLNQVAGMMRERRMARHGIFAMLAVERFRAVHGRPPASLDELARPDLTIDPSGEWTLRYVTPVPQARVVPGQPRDYLLLCHPSDKADRVELWLAEPADRLSVVDDWLTNPTRKAWKP